MSVNKVFLGNLPWSVTTDSLVALLRSMGYDFRSAKVISERESGRSRGFAFVEFDTPEAAAEAIHDLEGHVLDGRSLHASVANERPQHGRGGGGQGRSADHSEREVWGGEGDREDHRRDGKGRRERSRESRRW